MAYERTFPEYISRMVKWLSALVLLGSILCFPFLGWQGSGGWATGVLFHIAFLLLLKIKYEQWVRAEREAVFIGQKIALFTLLRFLAEILLAAAVIIGTPLHVFAFLAGLLSLPLSSFMVKAVNVMKE